MQVIPAIDLDHGRSRVVFWPGASSGVGAPTDRPERIAEQLVAAGATFAFSFGVTYVLALVLEKTIGFRVEGDDEMAGVDLAQHAETAYDLTPATGGARPHLAGGTGTLLDKD